MLYKLFIGLMYEISNYEKNNSHPYTNNENNGAINKQLHL